MLHVSILQITSGCFAISLHADVVSVNVSHYCNVFSFVFRITVFRLHVHPLLQQRVLLLVPAWADRTELHQRYTCIVAKQISNGK